MKTIKQIITVFMLSVFMLSSFDGNVQVKPSESTYDSAMTLLVETAKPFYTKGMNKNDFLNVTVGSGAVMNREMQILMTEIYNHVSAGSKYNGSTLEGVVKSNNNVDDIIKNSGKGWLKWLTFAKAVIGIIIEIFF